MKNIFNSHILIKGPQAMAMPLASQDLPTKTNNDKYTAPLSERDDGLQCSTLQHPPVFGKVRIFSIPVINISSNKTEIKNYNLKYWNPMAFFPF